MSMVTNSVAETITGTSNANVNVVELIAPLPEQDPSKVDAVFPNGSPDY